MRLVAISTVLALAVGATAAQAQPVPRARVGVTIGGGVEGFTNSELSRTAGTGGAWGLRVVAMSRSPISVEAAYQGSAQTIDAFGLDNSALLVGTALEAGARFNAFAGMPLSPYLAMGLAVRRYDLTRFDTNFSDVEGTDHVVELPIAAGGVLRFGRTIFDVRATFRAAGGSDLVPERDGESGMSMHRWGVSGNLGFEF